MANIRMIQIVIIALVTWLAAACSISAGIDIDSYLESLKNGKTQEVLVGKVDSLTINRPNVEFKFNSGQASVFFFNQDRPSAVVFEGEGEFSYVPPDEIEAFSLRKFFDRDTLDFDFDKIAIYFTSPLDQLLDTTGFTRMPVSGSAWNKISDSRKDALEHVLIYLPAKLIGCLVSESDNSYFYADFDFHGRNHLVYREDPSQDDYCRIYEITKTAGNKTADVIAGYSPQNLLPSQRGVKLMDIYHYDINSRIEAGGKMTVNCRIRFASLVDGLEYLPFTWYYDNDIIRASDSNGKDLKFIQQEEGFSLLDLAGEDYCEGLMLNSPLAANESTFVDLEYDCHSLEKYSTLYYISGLTSWYPQNPIRDYATFNLSFDTPDKYEVISCGQTIDDHKESGRHLQKFELNYPTWFISFNVGSFRHKEVLAEGFPPVEVYLATELADMSFEGSDFVGVADRLGVAGADVMNSLAFYTSVLGSCPFDTIKATSIPYMYGQGSPGLVHLSWSTFFDEDMQGYQESFRAHEVAHQWWGHVICNESYRDTWIIEGLAEYCGLWFYELSGQDKGAFATMLANYRDFIKGGTGIGSKGAKAGPVVLGHRLNSTKSDDYESQVYYKGAYIFHMIRYLLHDYKTGSDDKFAFFLKDLLVKFADKPITTEGLQEVLEGHAGGDMTWFFDQWVYGTNIPEYDFSKEAREVDDGKYKVTGHVTQKNVPDDFKMLVPITVLFKNNRYVSFKVWVDKPEVEISLPVLPYKPKRIIFNTYDAVLCNVEYR